MDGEQMDGEQIDGEQIDEEIAIEHLKKHNVSHDSNVYAIHVSPEGAIQFTSTNLEDDATLCLNYSSIGAHHTTKTMLRSELQELDRLGPNVGLVSYSVQPSDTRRLVFKYCFLIQFIHKLWNELNICMRLPPIPYLVPFDRVVLGKVHGRVVGFISCYIRGGTIQESPPRVFKLKWLQQWIQAVDMLNRNYGVALQDISPRNLLVDPETDSLMLFDFNYAGKIRQFNFAKEKNDIKRVIFSLYETITRDEHFREVPHHEQDPFKVE
jgi:hypothetical protein